jgi:hypothetical protein
MGMHDTGLANGPERFRMLANMSSQNLPLSLLYEDQFYVLLVDA